MTEKVRIDTGGNLLVGTTSAAGRLCVQGTAGGVALETTDATNSTFRISHPSSAVTLLSGGSSQHLALGTGFAEKMRITSDGNVGIGEDSPTSKLVVEGQVVVNNSNLLVDKHHIDGTDDWAGASHQLHHKRSFTNNTWTNYFKLYRSTTTANNNNVGVYGAMLHIVYINDRSNSVQTTGYDVFPFVVRARSSSTLSGTFGSALVDLENVIGSAIEVRFDSATANQINIQVKINNVDAGGSEQLAHVWIDGGGVASSSSLFLYPSILT